MAVATGFRFSCGTRFPLCCPPRRLCIRKVRVGSIAAAGRVDEAESFVVKDNTDNYDSLFANGRAVESVAHGGNRTTKWKKLSSKDLGINNSTISRATRVVMNGLKRSGFEVYLVGGCVRDLILKRTPKDFDVITSAELKEVMRTFNRCEKIGKRFPICHVHIGDTIVEVSSFSTSALKFKRDLSLMFEKPIDVEEKDYVRWRNCLERDFTINGLMFDPYGKLVYDYLGGMEDIRKAKVRTVSPASASFLEDCARILRAIRVAARLGFSFTRDTACAIKNLSSSVLRLDKSRLLMEMNYMLAYGSAEASLRLLWKFGLLEILLPIQAAYFVRTGFRRRDKRSNMLLSLFSNLDRLLAPDRPCHSSLWVAILAFHKAVSDHPRDPLVIAAFCLAVYNGGDMLEALKISRSITIPHDVSYYELADPKNMDSKSLIDEVMHLAASIKRAMSDMTDDYYVSRAMAEYPKAPYSDVVIISLTLYLRVNKIFECVREGKEEGYVAKHGSKVDHELLALGNLPELRHVFARVVFETVYPLTFTKHETHR